ncbi:MAG: nucleotidyltransferase family protein, partial [Firmicutes bacterium]|nr:nucleotidyltransferase family protein [Bacillota bacterium]
MKIAGIIAEYNPFHNGHSYHLEETKRITGADAVVAVISGSVTQRGEVALWDKWNRARMAVDNGVDLVLELPFAFAVNSAEEFARGGVSVLNSLGFVTDLVFGCEGDPDTVISMARRSAEREAEFQTAIRAGLEEGLSYPAARGKAMMQFLNEGESSESWEGESLDRPNDILAVEYVRQLVLQGSNMIPHGVKRLGSYHDDQVCES